MLLQIYALPQTNDLMDRMLTLENENDWIYKQRRFTTITVENRIQPTEDNRQTEEFDFGSRSKFTDKRDNDYNDGEWHKPAATSDERDVDLKSNKSNNKVKHGHFFDRVEELKAYKGKHGHLKIRPKDNRSLYKFCWNVRSAQRDFIAGKDSPHVLTEGRITALDAIGFDWALRQLSGFFIMLGN